MADAGSTHILGAWQLDSWLIEHGHGSEPVLPFGEKPGGLLLYSADGWMSATVHNAQRAEFPPNRSPRSLDADNIAAAYRSYFHYAGTWRVEADRVIHRVLHSLNPNMVGTEQVRQMQLNGSSLILTGIEPVAGTNRRHVLQWRRPAR